MWIRGLVVGGLLVGRSLFDQGAAKIEAQILLLNEAVVQTQWTHSLDLVNMPENRKLLNPGQCVVVGVIATGDHRDDYLRGTKLSYKVTFAGRTDLRDVALIASYKKLKPEGGDFVSGALAAAGIQTPDIVRTMASSGVTGAHWCAQLDADDGVAQIDATIEPASGPAIRVRSPIEVQAFATGARKLFKGGEEFGPFMQTYYRQPNPARLLPAVEFLVEDQTQHPQSGQAGIAGAFLVAALKGDPAGAHYLLSRIANEAPLARGLG